eukprot:496684_1
MKDVFMAKSVQIVTVYHVPNARQEVKECEPLKHWWNGWKIVDLMAIHWITFESIKLTENYIWQNIRNASMFLYNVGVVRPTLRNKIVQNIHLELLPKHQDLMNDI